MKPHYHRAITEQALRPHFNPAALESVVRANLGQDALQYQFVHDHFHFDNSSFVAGDAYLEEQRRTVKSVLENGSQPLPARAAFGRLTHAAQDFYAHSNYIALWRERNPGAAPDAIDPQLAEALTDPRLHSGRIYPPLEWFSFLPWIGHLVVPLLPRDSHAWMNKDDPSRPDFDFAFAAAVKRTRLELDLLRAQLTPDQFARFTGSAAANR